MAKVRKCPTCDKELTRKYPRRMVFECQEHGLFKAVVRRRPRSSFNPKDSSTWRARCDDCGGQMEYYNLKYCCNKCGNIMYV